MKKAYELFTGISPKEDTTNFYDKNEQDKLIRNTILYDLERKAYVKDINSGKLKVTEKLVKEMLEKEYEIFDISKITKLTEEQITKIEKDITHK
ncbi:MAG: hypothetical protein RSB00_04505 [Bacilli bacterium]